MDSRIKVGLIGYPLSHSLSPYIHNEAFKFFNMNWEYSLYEINEEKFNKEIKHIKAKLLGFNVTIPYKQRIMEYLDSIDIEAEKIGAVNTVKKENSKFVGYNTDYLGFVEDLKKNNFNIKGKKSLVLGTGGAGYAVCFGLLKEGIKEIYVYDIDRKKAILLEYRVKKYYSVEFFVLDYLDISEKLKEVDLVVNTTPCGMKEDDAPPIDLKFLDVCKKNVFIYDVIYNRETEFVKYAREKSLKAISGWGMLLGQAAMAWELWTGRNAPRQIMEKVLKEKLGIKEG